MATATIAQGVVFSIALVFSAIGTVGSSTAETLIFPALVTACENFPPQGRIDTTPRRQSTRCDAVDLACRGNHTFVFTKPEPGDATFPSMTQVLGAGGSVLEAFPVGEAPANIQSTYMPNSNCTIQYLGSSPFGNKFCVSKLLLSDFVAEEV